ncbi:alanine--glyoxylate aminotransferase family protein [Candidatus Nitronereus thalassa]|uniref:Alanine--glyoxylate aminotransferase family protein n=1 Tax=Candidatus Nitronereus thalassa TaxID=3020898 RepID=A0ABU3KBC3_9BACT|nr:alanine--glyoxylate aminotransferase family protein [Candidatus Nitronereus thalassa]MDT7043810.1 alanine--glyoxylate aminotransferase family protein [Candidatus Nitronereus thalassa]
MPGFTQQYKDLSPSRRLLLGPGPSLVHPRVLRAMSTPLIGHLDPEFLVIMDEIQELLRWLFQTDNSFTIAVSGTGSAAMETAIVNLIEPGDRVIVGMNGIFGARIAQMVTRCGGTVVEIQADWGTPIPLDQIAHQLQAAGPIKAVAIVHAETSTGVWQPLDNLGALCHGHEALLIVDTVTSLGGLPVKVDEWDIDACYSATQKCLSCPPGLAPLTLSDRALHVIQNRNTPCQSWYLDCTLVADYWTKGKRTYHHTAPISMAYALREALRLIHEEGLDARFARHQRNSQALRAGLEALGFTLVPAPGHSLLTLTCVALPEWLDDKTIRSRLLHEFHIEVGGGLGPLAGKVWRIGLMGESSTFDSVVTLLAALEHLSSQANPSVQPGKAVSAALQKYNTWPR